MKNFKVKFAVIAIIGFAIISCSKSDVIPDPDPEPEPTLSLQFNASTDQLTINHEFRAAWLTTAYKLDWPGNTTGATAQSSLLVSLIDKIYNLNMNVVLFQAMTSSATFYPSEILPWTDYLTGTQGVDPGYDPLQVAIDAAHSRGMELHVWMNPLRVGSTTQNYAANHPALLHPTWYSTYNNVRYWNPGLPEVRTYLENVIKEVLNNYDIDGIHFDDYFYPDGLKTNPGTWDDSQAFALYGGTMTLAQWRENNINLMVQACYNAVKDVKPKALFGISPSGQIANALALYANPLTWMSNKWVDYLAPQQYWQIGHSTADFSNLTLYWHNNNNGVSIIPGLAPYRLGESGFPYLSEFQNEVNLTRSYSSMKGNCWFRTEHIVNTSIVGSNTLSMSSFIKNNIYKSKSLVPKIGLYTENTPATPSITLNQRVISWQSISGATGYAVYELEREGTSTKWNANLKYEGNNTTYEGSTKKNYIVLAKNGRTKSSYQQVVFIP